MSLSDLNNEQLVKAIDNMLNGIPYESSNGYDPDPPENPIIKLLKNENNPIRDKIIEILQYRCIKLYDAYYANGELFNSNQIPLITRLCRIIDITSPPELRFNIIQLQGIVVANKQIDSSIRMAIIRATMAYKFSINYWANLICDECICAYAFNAMLSINANAREIDRALGFLYLKKLSEKWPVDIEFLAKRTLRKRKETDESI